MELVIINRLLDKYEKSRQATGEPCVRRRVSLKTEGLAEYHGREIDYRKAFHLAAENLQQQGLIQVDCAFCSRVFPIPLDDIAAHG